MKVPSCLVSTCQIGHLPSRRRRFCGPGINYDNDIGLSAAPGYSSNYYLVMPTNIYQWIELAACLVIVYIVFHPLVNFLDKIFES
jgi:hypothetical protein